MSTFSDSWMSTRSPYKIINYSGIIIIIVIIIIIIIIVNRVLIQ
jgi:hypothetical protein